MTLPPGRARLATRPAPTGSPAFVITMGMVVVAFFAANAGGIPCDHDQINLKTNQVRRKLRQALSLLLGKSVLDGDILSLNPSKLAQLLPERLHEDRATRSSACIQETYAEDFPCLLRVGHTRQSEARTIAKIPAIVRFSISILDCRIKTRSCVHVLFSLPHCLIA